MKENMKCDGCKTFGRVGVHSFACPIRKEDIVISPTPTQDKDWEKELRTHAEEWAWMFADDENQAGLSRRQREAADKIHWSIVLSFITSLLKEREARGTWRKGWDDAVDHFEQRKLVWEKEAFAQGAQQKVEEIKALLLTEGGVLDPNDDRMERKGYNRAILELREKLSSLTDNHK